MAARLTTRIGKTYVEMAVSRYAVPLSDVSTYPFRRRMGSAASYFVGDDYPARRLVIVEGVTVGDVLAQAYRDLA